MKLFSRQIFLIFFFIILLIAVNSNSKLASANPGAVNVREIGQQGLIAVINNTLEMTNANVIFNVDVDENSNSITKDPIIKIEFYGEYTIYNPNETIELTIANPFPFDLSIEDLSFKVNETPISFYLDEYTLTVPIIGYEYIGLCAVADILFEEGTTTIIEFAFSHTIEVNREEIVLISYDVGTANTWNGEITEQVEFIVSGAQPRFCAENCIITEAADGKSYLWEWNNEQITVDNVYLNFKISERDFIYQPIVVFIMGVSVMVGVLLVLHHKPKPKKDNS